MRICLRRRWQRNYCEICMKSEEYFENYLSTARFTDPRNRAVAYKFYESEYAAYLPRDTGARILDIGCGMGEFITYLRTKKYSNVSGVDVSSEMVDFCRKQNIANVELVRDVVEYLSQKAGTFDFIVLNDTLEHLPKKDTVGIVKAIRLSLKEGGILLLRTVNFSTLGGMYIRYKDFTHEIAYTEYSLEQVLSMAGFKNVRITGNKYPINFGIFSLLRAIALRVWFLILKLIYLVELGCDRPRIYSKMLIAVCRK